MDPRIVSPTEAAHMFQPRDFLGIPLGPGQPTALLHALGTRDDWEELTVFGALLIDLYAVFSHPGVRFLSGFFGPAERFLVESGARVEFVPADFRRFTRIIEQLAPRVVATMAAPPDPAGFLSLSLHAGATVDAVAQAAADPHRVLMVETNARFPRTHGLLPLYPHRVHIDDVDVLIESDRDPFVLPETEPSPVDIAIAEHAQTLIPNGATLQTGIGGIPSTVMGLIAQGDGGDYGVHSEMFTTGLMKLHQAGKVSNRQKGQFGGASITTFAAGTLGLYEWLDENSDVAFLPVDIVNSPEVITANRNMVTINGALVVDLYGQVVADTIGGHQFSGIGGHEDFIAPSGLSLDDRSLVCLPSTAIVNGTRISRIVATLTEGWIVTTPRHQLDLVITEHGIAPLRGRTVRERARALALIADPEFRDELLAAAERAG